MSLPLSCLRSQSWNETEPGSRLPSPHSIVLWLILSVDILSHHGMSQIMAKQCHNSEIKLQNPEAGLFLLRQVSYLPKLGCHPLFREIPLSSSIHTGQKVETTKCPSVDEQINKTWSIQIREQYSVIKRKAVLIAATTEMNPENTVKSKN